MANQKGRIRGALVDLACAIGIICVTALPLFAEEYDDTKFQQMREASPYTLLEFELNEEPEKVATFMDYQDCLDELRIVEASTEALAASETSFAWGCYNTSELNAAGEEW